MIANEVADSEDDDQPERNQKGRKTTENWQSTLGECGPRIQRSELLVQTGMTRRIGEKGFNISEVGKQGQAGVTCCHQSREMTGTISQSDACNNCNNCAILS